MATASNTKEYDCIVIGSGQGATPLANAFTTAGRRTALIERSHIGGCCVNEGCTPTKTMIASGKVAYHTQRAADYGIHSPGAEDGLIVTDMKKVRQRKRDIVDSFRTGGETRAQSAGVDVLKGVATFTDSKKLSVKMDDGSERNVTAERIFISTGERPSIPQLTGLESIPAERQLDSTTIQELDVVPTSLLVLGGGYIGLEFGQLFNRLGSEVTIVQRSSQLLPREDPDIAASMLDIFREDGIKVHLSTTAVSISPGPSDSDVIRLLIRSAEGSEYTVSASHILFAAGRRPNTDMLNLEAAGIFLKPSSHIEVNDRLETSVPGIWALGDVKGPPAFTHISYDDFRIIQRNVLEPHLPSLTTKGRIVPYVCYTDPQMGHIGLHEYEARKQFPDRKIQTAKMPMAYVARALETDESRGLMKAVVDGETGEILGYTCLGLEGGELMSVVQMAMMGNVPWQRLRDAVWAHPSLAESLNNLWGFLE
ncbi:hypothetical protein MMC34_002849 [Xylographa carneopallida]|nr:hypothetical protein [Xylographa carneopallida]